MERRIFFSRDTVSGSLSNLPVGHNGVRDPHVPPGRGGHATQARGNVTRRTSGLSDNDADEVGVGVAREITDRLDARLRCIAKD